MQPAWHIVLMLMHPAAHLYVQTVYVVFHGNAQAEISGGTADKDYLHVVEVYVSWQTRLICVQSAAIA